MEKMLLLLQNIISQKKYHTVYFKFSKHNYYYVNSIFYGLDRIFSVNFSDFNEYTPSIALYNMFNKCTNLKEIYTTLNNNNFIPIDLFLRNNGDEQWPSPCFFTCDEERSKILGERVIISNFSGLPGEQCKIKIKINLKNIKTSNETTQHNNVFFRKDGEIIVSLFLDRTFYYDEETKQSTFKMGELTIRYDDHNIYFGECVYHDADELLKAHDNMFAMLRDVLDFDEYTSSVVVDTKFQVIK